MRKTVMAEKGPAPAGPYSHAVVAGDFVFISGQGPVNPETGTMPDAFTDQVRQTFTRFAEFNEVYKEFFENDPPARTTVGTNLLGMQVEVDCIAVVE